MFLSLSYDRIIVIRPGYFVDVAAGVGFTPSVARANLSHQIIINKGRKSSFFMFGAGGILKADDYALATASGWGLTLWPTQDFAVSLSE